MNKNIILIIIIIVLMLGALFFTYKNGFFQENSNPDENQVGNNTNTDEKPFSQIDDDAIQVISEEKPPMPPQ